MTQKQIVSLAKRLGRLADDKNIDELTRRLCVDAVEAVIQDTSDGFDTVKAGYMTGRLSLQDWRELTKTSVPMFKTINQMKNQL